MTLIVSMLCTIMLLALGGALMITAVTERQAAAAEERAREAFHAAEAVAERAIDDLALLADWTPALDGTRRSAFVDGSSSGVRSIGGLTLDLDALTTEVNGWSAVDGQWRLFAHAPVAALLPGRIASPMYAVAWISSEPTLAGAIVVRGHAYGPTGARRMIEVVVDRSPRQTIRVLAWREYRQ